jgi:hypothetical protein
MSRVALSPAASAGTPVHPQSGAGAAEMAEPPGEGMAVRRDRPEAKPPRASGTCSVGAASRLRPLVTVSEGHGIVRP